MGPLAAIVARFAKGGGLPRYYRGVGIHVGGFFGACSTFTARCGPVQIADPRRGRFSEYSAHVVT